MLLWEIADKVNTAPKGGLRPNYDRSGDKKTPIKRAPIDFSWWIGGNQRMMDAKTAAMKWAERHSKIETIKFSDLLTAQKGVNGDDVEKYLNGKPHEDYPVVQRVGGLNLLYDGNHRTTAAILKGETEGRFRVLDLHMFDLKGNLTKEWLDEHPL